MFLEVEMHEHNIFRGVEARRKFWFMFLKVTGQKQRYD